MTRAAIPIQWKHHPAGTVPVTKDTASPQKKPPRIVVKPHDAYTPDLWERILREIPYLIPETDNWRSYALCQTVDPELWFPERGSTPGKFFSARDICAQCPVRRECLETALDNNETYGIWGGFSAPGELRIIRRSRELYLQREKECKSTAVSRPPRRHAS